MDQRTNLIALEPVACAARRPVALAGRATAVCVALLCLLSVSPARATVDIQGSLHHLRLNVINASIAEILTALSTRFKVTYRLQSPIARTLTGNYSGSLRETLTRILDGNDYILELSDAGCNVLILGASPADARTPPSSHVAATPANSQVISAPVPAMPPAPGAARPGPLPSVSPPPPLSDFLSQNRPATAAE